MKKIIINATIIVIILLLGFIFGQYSFFKNSIIIFKEESTKTSINNIEYQKINTTDPINILNSKYGNIKISYGKNELKEPFISGPQHYITTSDMYDHIVMFFKTDKSTTILEPKIKDENKCIIIKMPLGYFLNKTDAPTVTVDYLKSQFQLELTSDVTDTLTPPYYEKNEDNLEEAKQYNSIYGKYKGYNVLIKYVKNNNYRENANINIDSTIFISSNRLKPDYLFE